MIGHVPGGRRIPELRRALPDPKRNWAPRPVPSSPPSAGSRTAGSARRSAWPSWRPSSGCENCPWVRPDPRCRRGPALMLSAAFALRGSPDETPQELRTGYPGRLITPRGRTGMGCSPARARETLICIPIRSMRRSCLCGMRFHSRLAIGCTGTQPGVMARGAPQWPPAFSCSGSS